MLPISGLGWNGRETPETIGYVEETIHLKEWKDHFNPKHVG